MITTTTNTAAASSIDTTSANARDRVSNLPLGEVITWELPSLEVPYHSVRRALVDAGLSLDYAKPMRASTAFNRACDRLKESRTIDKVKREGGIITFQFTRKYLEQDGARLGFSFEAIVRLDTSLGTITCDQNEQLAAHARQLFTHEMGHRSTSDITRIVQHLFSSSADLFPINPKKGVAYFVPQHHAAFIGKVSKFLGSLGGNLLRFPVPKGTEQGDIAVQTAVDEGLRSILSEVRAAAADWDTTTRGKTMAKTVEQWKQVSFKADCYAEYLGDKQAALLAELAAAKQELHAKIMEVHNAKQ